MKEWSEDLPEKCPPHKAFSPEGHTFYRLVKSKIPSEEDFFSQRKLKPNRKFKNVSECILCSLSVFDDIDSCKNLLRSPLWKGANIYACKLTSSDGVMLKTFKNEHHYSWWKRNSFKIESIYLVTE